MTLVGSTPSSFIGTKTYVSTGAVDCDHIDYTSTEKVTYEDRPSRANLVADEGDILFAKMCATKKTLRLDDETAKHIYSTGFCAVRANKSVMIPELLFHLLSSEQFLAQKDQNSSGATQKAITNSGLTKIKINIPKISEQQGLAEKLDMIDVLIAARREQLAKLDQLVKSRFVELFGDEQEYFAKARNQVSDVCESKVGIVIQPTQYYTEDANNSVKAFRSLNVKPFRVNDADWVYFTVESNNLMQRTQVHTNDVAVVRSGVNLGDSCVVTEEFDGCNAIDILILTPKSCLLPIYLSAFINYPCGKNQIINAQRGGALKHLNNKQLQDAQIYLPPIELQKQFAAFVEHTDKSKLAIQQSLDKLELLKKSLMQEYFG